MEKRRKNGKASRKIHKIGIKSGFQNIGIYINLEETKMRKIRIVAGKRAIRFEEKTKENEINKILQE